MANIITGIRIVLSAALLICPALSPTFYVLYMTAGLSDMIDGTVARRTGTASDLGSKLDTVADIVFVVICLPASCLFIRCYRVPSDVISYSCNAAIAIVPSSDNMK